MADALGTKDRTKKKLLAAGVAVIVIVALVVGLLVGLLGPWGPNRNASSAQTLQLQELPPPGSPAARQLLSDPNTPAWILAVYAHHNDGLQITADSSSAFLLGMQQQEEIQHQLQRLSMQQQSPDTKMLVNGVTNGSRSSSSSSSSSSGVDLTPFVRVATDILNYLRYSQSAAMLQMLRDFSANGVLDIQAVDPDVLQAEVQQLLNLTNLNKFYVAAGRSDGVGRDSMVPQQAQGRRLHHHHHQQQQQQEGQQQQRLSCHTSRQLHAMASIPDVPTAATVQAGHEIPTNSPQQSLKDMLCAIKAFSPVGLDGITVSSSGSTAPAPLECSAPELGLFSYNGVAFQPVVVPVVFHCLRFKKDGVLGPALWDPLSASQNMVQVANKLYNGTGIQFKLSQVRSDPAVFPYLLLPALDDWQACTVNPSSTAAGHPCLTKIAKDPLVETLTTHRHMLNVFIAGSRDEAAWCDVSASPAPVCAGVVAGFSNAWGPWFADGDASWSEEGPEANWVFLTWDMFNPAARNSARFWDGGGATFAHEAGHYLGLMHTHEGTKPCDGNGINKADAVPDTPVNMQTDVWASQHNGLATLTGWCSDFRIGKKPPVDELSVFNSCNSPGSMDNVFNVMSYTPDPCTLYFTPNQIARMQWAIASFRPKMMQEHAAR